MADFNWQGLMSGIGAGLRGGGAALSPQITELQYRERAQQANIAQQQKEMDLQRQHVIANAILQQIQLGNIDPNEGYSAINKLPAFSGSIPTGTVRPDVTQAGMGMLEAPQGNVGPEGAGVPSAPPAEPPTEEEMMDQSRQNQEDVVGPILGQSGLMTPPPTPGVSQAPITQAGPPTQGTPAQMLVSPLPTPLQSAQQWQAQQAARQPQVTVDPETGQTIAKPGEGLPGLEPAPYTLQDINQVARDLVSKGYTPAQVAKFVKEAKDQLNRFNKDRMDQIIARKQIAAAEAQIGATKRVTDDIATSQRDSEGKQLYQHVESLDGGKTWRNVGAPHAKESGVAVNIGEKEDQKHASAQVQKEFDAFDASQQQMNNLEDLKNLNDKGVLGGTGARMANFVYTAMDTFFVLPEEAKQKLARSNVYDKVTNQEIMSILRSKVFPQRVTNVDLQFLQRTMPDITMSKEARTQIIDMMQHYLKQQEARYDSIVKWRDAHNGTIGGWKPPKVQSWSSSRGLGFEPEEQQPTQGGKEMVIPELQR